MLSTPLYKRLYAVRWEIRNRSRRLAVLVEQVERERARLVRLREEADEVAHRLLMTDPEMLAKVPRWRS